MSIFSQIKDKKLYGIIREDNFERAYEILRAYVEGGLKFIELNCPFELTKKATEEFPDIIISQGGIITTTQAHLALELGAKIISSPIFQMNLVRFSSCYKVFLIPSATTPNEAYSAWQARIPLIKIYPAAKMGGVSYLKDLIRPMPFLNLLPCGFVKIEEIQDYLKIGAPAVAIGREFYNKENYTEIVKTIKEAVKMVELI